MEINNSCIKGLNLEPWGLLVKFYVIYLQAYNSHYRNVSNGVLLRLINYLCER